MNHVQSYHTSVHNFLYLLLKVQQNLSLQTSANHWDHQNRRLDKILKGNVKKTKQQQRHDSLEQPSVSLFGRSSWSFLVCVLAAGLKEGPEETDKWFQSLFPKTEDKFTVGLNRGILEQNAGNWVAILLASTAKSRHTNSNWPTVTLTKHHQKTGRHLYPRFSYLVNLGYYLVIMLTRAVKHFTIYPNYSIMTSRSHKG